jgi:hypothetical protein
MDKHSDILTIITGMIKEEFDMKCLDQLKYSNIDSFNTHAALLFRFYSIVLPLWLWQAAMLGCSPQVSIYEITCNLQQQGLNSIVPILRQTPNYQSISTWLMIGGCYQTRQECKLQDLPCFVRSLQPTSLPFPRLFRGLFSHAPSVPLHFVRFSSSSKGS